MKKQLLIAALLAISLGVGAQTTTGFNVTGTISAVDFTSKLPLNNYLGDHSGRQNLNLGVEAGYSGKTFGLAITGQTDFDMDSEALLGLKGSATLFTWQNIVFKAAIYGRSFVNPVVGSQWQYGGEGQANLPLTGALYGRLAIDANMTGDRNFNQIRPGVSIGLGFNL